MSLTVRVFDPALCCATGVCGPSVDPELARFAADVKWLEGRGATVERFNLAQQPGAFVEPVVVEALERLGEAALPLVQLNGETIAMGHYPTRAVLAKLVGLPMARAKPEDSCCGPKTADPGGEKCC